MNRALLTVRLAAISLAAVFADGCTTDTTTTGHSSSAPTATTAPPSISTTTATRTTTAASTTTAPTAAASASTATPTTDAVADDRVQGLIDRWASDGRGGVAVALASHDGDLTVASTGSAGPDGGTVEPGSQFRVGSLTKAFGSVIMLQLVDDGTIGLDDLVVDDAPELTIADGVTIRQLLAHRSGLPEYTDGELAPAVLADRARTWTPLDVLALVAGQPGDFPPGTAFAYANTKYVVAGLLLESITGMTLAENLQSRIVEPLGPSHTYFAPDGTHSPIGGFSDSLPGGDTSGASYRALETASGAAASLVSTASDLATFIRALAHGQLLNKRTYAEMTKGLPDDGQTLGVFAADRPTATGIPDSGTSPASPPTCNTARPQKACSCSSSTTTQPHVRIPRSLTAAVAGGELELHRYGRAVREVVGVDRGAVRAAGSVGCFVAALTDVL